MVDEKYVSDHLSFAEGDDIQIIVNKLPILSYISYIDNNDEFHYGGILTETHKTFFRIIQDPTNLEDLAKVKYSKIKRIYYVENRRSSNRIYIQNNKDKKKEFNRRYYLKKKQAETESKDLKS